MKQSKEMYEHLTELQERNDMLLEALKNTMQVLRVLRDTRPTEYDVLLAGQTDYLDMWDNNKKAIAQAEGRE